MPDRYDSAIAELEAATEGSHDLDRAVVIALGWTTGLTKHPNSREFPPFPRGKVTTVWFDENGIERGAACFERSIRPYTTSLDAKLPGENIIMVSEQHAPEGQPCKWVAVQRYPKGTYGHAAIAHTEPLARRIAALRARKEL